MTQILTNQYQKYFLTLQIIKIMEKLIEKIQIAKLDYIFWKKKYDPLVNDELNQKYIQREKEALEKLLILIDLL